MQEESRDPAPDLCRVVPGGGWGSGGGSKGPDMTNQTWDLQNTKASQPFEVCAKTSHRSAAAFLGRLGTWGGALGADWQWF